MEKKQSSVEWFADRIDDIVELYPEQRQKVMDAYLQAKAMHREEIRRAWCDGFPFTWANSNQTAKEYYNETFGE